MQQLYNNNSADVLNIVKSIFHHLNVTNLDNMVKKMIVLPVRTVQLLEKISDLIHIQALTRYNFTILFARLCACLINDSNFNKLGNSKITFQKLLVQKCYDVFSSYETYQQDLAKLKKNFNQHQELSYFITTLGQFQFNYNNRVLSNIKFMCELFKKDALPKKIILICITELSEKKDDLHMYCLCLMLKLVGQKLSKTHNLDDIMKLILLYKNENNYPISSTLNSLILELKKLHLNNWMNKELDLLNNINCLKYERLPVNLQKEYELKSYYLMAESIFEDCYAVLLKFSIKKEVNETIQLLTNTWIKNDHTSFVVSMILVAINEGQIIRYDAGKLLDYLVMNRFLSKYSIVTGVSKVLNDYGIKIDFPNLSNLVCDVTSGLNFN